MRRETVKHLERALNAIRFAPIPELVQCLYRQARVGSPLAERLLHPSVDREALCGSLPMAMLLESLQWEDQESLRQMIKMLKLACLPRQTVSETIKELHMRLRQRTGE